MPRAPFIAGRHIGIAQGYGQSLRYAEAIGCTSLQVFPGNPTGWSHTDLPVDAAAAIRAARQVAQLSPVVIHAPYIINLASPDPVVAQKSGVLLGRSLARAREIGADYVVVHTGSHKDTGPVAGIERIVAGVMAVLDADLTGQAMVLLENSAGAGHTIGASLGELGGIIHSLPSRRVGVCIDTAHLWGMGYAIDSPEGVEKTLAEVATTIGWDRVGVVHLNDSRAACASRRDIHAHLGLGQIGADGLSQFLRGVLARRPTVPVILETPDEGLERERARLCVLIHLADGDIAGALALNAEIAALPIATGSFG